MAQVLVGGFIALHGLITTMIGASAINSPSGAALQAPSWMSWWPGPFGRSWVFDALSLGIPAAVVGGLIWLLAGLALLGAGLGIVGIPVLADAARTLLVSGAFLGLVAVALYFHPFYAVALLIDVALPLLLWRGLLPAV